MNKPTSFKQAQSPLAVRSPVTSIRVGVARPDQAYTVGHQVADLGPRTRPVPCYRDLVAANRRSPNLA